MKRVIAILLALVLALGFVACGQLSDSDVEALAKGAVEITEALAEASDERNSAQTANTPESSAAQSGAAAAPESEPTDEPTIESALPADTLAEDGSYTTKEDVALYIHLYGHLPDNFITKKEAEALGWPGGDLRPYAPDKCIGGSRYSNYEGTLPTAKGRSYTECDIDTLGASRRGAKRIVFSNDGLIYYTDDHYETFTLLYGEE